MSTQKQGIRTEKGYKGQIKTQKLILDKKEDR